MPERDQARAALAERRAHHVRGGRGARGEPVGAERAQADEVHREVEHHDAGDAEQQRPRQVALGPRSSPITKPDGLPAAVGEQHRHERRAERRDEVERRRPVEHGRERDALAAEGREAGRDEAEDRDGLQHHQQRLHAAARAHAEAVDGGERRERQHGDRPPRAAAAPRSSPR